MNFNFYAIFHLISAFIVALFSLLVFIKNTKSEVNRSFSIFGLAILLWLLFSSFASLFIERKDIFFWFKMSYVGIILIPLSFSYFIHYYLKIRSRFVLFFAWIYAITFLSLLWFTDFLVEGLYKYPWGYYPKVSLKFHPLFLISFIIIFAHSIFGLVFKIRSIHETALGKLRAKYILIGTLFGICGSVDFFANYGIDVYPFGFIFIIIYPFILAYAILKYRLMDIKIAVTRAGIFAVVYTLVLGLPFWFSFKSGLWWWGMVFMAVLASSGPFIYNYLRRQTEAQLLKEDRKRYAELKGFARTIGLVRDLDKLLKLIVYRLTKTLRISYGLIYLFDRESNLFSLGAVHSLIKPPPAFPQTLSPESAFIKFILQQERDFLYEDIQRLAEKDTPLNNQLNLKEVSRQMRESKASLVIPHFLEKELIGFLVLGQKVSGQSYSPEDIEVLTTLSRSASLAIMNCLFMLDLKKSEGELAEAHRIAQLGYLASSTGHQINNVLNNIAAIASGLGDDELIADALKDRPQAASLLAKYVQDILTNVEDGGLIIRELRDYAQSERDKKFSLVNLKEVLDKTLRILYIYANKFQTIDIVIDIPPDIPPLLGSFVSLQNVFVNMFNNAYDAIVEKRRYLQAHPEEGIAGYKGRIEVKISRVKNNVHIHIIDDGKGMSPEVQKRLFTPLYTTKTSSEKRREQKLTGGTGIGLYAILVIIKNHAGAIKLERSEHLKGSDFLIQLPIPKEKDIPKE